MYPHHPLTYKWHNVREGSAIFSFNVSWNGSKSKTAPWPPYSLIVCWHREWTRGERGGGGPCTFHSKHSVGCGWATLPWGGRDQKQKKQKKRATGNLRVLVDVWGRRLGLSCSWHQIGCHLRSLSRPRPGVGAAVAVAGGGGAEGRGAERREGRCLTTLSVLTIFTCPIH